MQIILTTAIAYTPTVASDVRRTTMSFVTYSDRKLAYNTNLCKKNRNNSRR